PPRRRASPRSRPPGDGRVPRARSAPRRPGCAPPSPARAARGRLRRSAPRSPAPRRRSAPSTTCRSCPRRGSPAARAPGCRAPRARCPCARGRGARRTGRATRGARAAPSGERFEALLERRDLALEAILLVALGGHELGPRVADEPLVGELLARPRELVARR